MDFQYKVTVIVPVYNVEQYLRDCLDSLVAQTIDHSQMEVLLINDGSTDESLAICREYEIIYGFFKVFSQKNAGVSSARNLGIDNAQGKYIMFLDSDDSFSPETLKSVTEYFDSVYDKTDVVTYPEKKYNEGQLCPIHFRYMFLKRTGIYDINKNIYLTVSRVNIAIKNKLSCNSHFNTDLAFAEDQEYIYSLLKDKMNVGFVNEGLYKYNLHNDSVVGSSGYAYYFWESVVANYYEKLFNSYNTVPKYLQAMFLYDSNWKIRKDQFLPYHYEGDEYTKAVGRIVNILNKIDDDVILNHPALDFYHKFYLFKLKGSPIVLYTEKNSYQILLNGKVLKKDIKFEIIIVRFRLKNNQVDILGHIKSVIFDFIEKPTLIASLDGISQKVALFDSTQSRYKSKIKTNQFWGFYFKCDCTDLKKIEFTIEIDNQKYPVKFFFMKTSPFNKELNCSDYCCDGKSVSVTESGFSFNNIDEIRQKNYLTKVTKAISSANSEVFKFRLSSNYPAPKKIWLYYDCGGVDKDNGYYQFIHDFDKDDGIERYYINNNPEIKPGLFEDKHSDYIIQFGSEVHKGLFIHCSKIITAFAERDNIFPFDRIYDGVYADILNFDVIYLQHGILHASIPWKYTPESLRIDKIVVSSEFEAENFHKKYNFRKEDIIKTGMPRFLHLDRTAEPKRRILFAPSWRNYLITPQVKNYWAPLPDKFVASDYFKKINEFIHSERLISYLKEHGLCVDFKLHPIFYNAYKELFDLDEEAFFFADNSVRDEDYCAFVTDFSSFVFDFAYLKRPIFYFVPDYPQFRAGMNQYRQLDLPFDKAFGRLVTEADDAVDELIRIAEKGFVPDEVYKERMDGFFLPMENCEEKLYNYLIKDDNAQNASIDLH